MINMNNKEPGYVYILTHSTSGRLHTCKNPSFREDWVKIGKSSRLFFIGNLLQEEHRNTSGAYQGAKYFSYNGKVLDDIRKEREDNEKS